MVFLALDTAMPHPACTACCPVLAAHRAADVGAAKVARGAGLLPNSRFFFSPSPLVVSSIGRLVLVKVVGRGRAWGRAWGRDTSPKHLCGPPTSKAETRVRCRVILCGHRMRRGRGQGEGRVSWGISR